MAESISHAAGIALDKSWGETEINKLDMYSAALGDAEVDSEGHLSWMERFEAARDGLLVVLSDPKLPEFKRVSTLLHTLFYEQVPALEQASANQAVARGKIEQNLSALEKIVSKVYFNTPRAATYEEAVWVRKTSMGRQLLQLDDGSEITRRPPALIPLSPAQRQALDRQEEQMRNHVEGLRTKHGFSDDLGEPQSPKVSRAPPKFVRDLQIARGVEELREQAVDLLAFTSEELQSMGYRQILGKYGSKKFEEFLETHDIASRNIVKDRQGKWWGKRIDA